MFLQDTWFLQLLELWLNGPDWLYKPETWPASVHTGPSKETEAEAKLVKEVVSVAVETSTAETWNLAHHPYHIMGSKVSS